MSAPALELPQAASPTVREVVEGQLRPAAVEIDRDGAYPRDVMRALGAAGAFVQLADGPGGIVGKADLAPTIEAVRMVAEECASTAFCCWCQAALTWYLRCTDNLPLRRRMLSGVATGEILGGTALSNPMKARCGLQDLMLKSAPADDGQGWRVSGVIPWVSNIEAGHPFGAVFSVPGASPVMAVVDDTMEGLSIRPNDDYEVMAGTATVSTTLRKVAVGEDRLLARDAPDFIARIRPGFVLIQAGIGLGLLEAAARVMEATRRAHSEGLPGGLLSTPAQVRDTARRLHERVMLQAADIAAGERVSSEDLFALRLDLAEAAVRGATSAQLMAGAPGLLRGRRAARLLREAAFYGVLTPSVRHLSHVLERKRGKAIPAA